MKPPNATKSMLYNSGWGWMSGWSNRPLIRSMPDMTATTTTRMRATIRMLLASKCSPRLLTLQQYAGLGYLRRVWGGLRDLNPRPSDPQSDALTS
jgi:hypothetical protein